MSRAVTVRCVVCGLEVVGVEGAQGMVRPSDRSRPGAEAAIKDGYCIRDLLASRRQFARTPIR